jgi:hypothetical protein
MIAKTDMAMDAKINVSMTMSEDHQPRWASIFCHTPIFGNLFDEASNALARRGFAVFFPGGRRPHLQLA